MSNSDSAELELKRFGLSFVQPQIESNYRRWRNEQAFQRVQFTALVSMLLWSLVVEAEPMLLAFGYQWPDNARWIVYGFIVPTCLLGIAIPYLPSRPGLLNVLRGYLLPLFTIAMIVVGNLLSLWFNLLNPKLQHYPLALITVLVFMLWIPFVRIPTWQSLLILTAYFVPVGLYLWVGWPSGNLDHLDIWSAIAALVLGGFICQASAVAVDRDQRRSYVQKLTVKRQRERLEFSQKLIRRYVPAAVADHIVDGRGEHIDAPQRRRITILFSDIVGFTDMADRLDAESLTQILNEYMAAMAEIIEQHDGTLNEFIGDGIMAMFGAPHELDPKKQALQAIAAAQAMHQKIPELHRRWRKLGLGEELKIRIGINTGVLSVGSFGSEGRMTYTAIGLQANIAARIQSHCEPGNTLISDATYQLVDEVIECEPRGEVECKGVHFPVKVYAPKVTA